MFSLVLVIYLLVAALRLWLRQLNLKHVQKHGRTLPAGFATVISAEQLSMSVDYAVAQSRLALQEFLVTQVFALGLVFAGGLAVYDRWLVAAGWPWLLQGLGFFAGLALLSLFLSLPFDYYRQFVLEETFGFNTMTRSLWFVDLGKSLLLSMLIGGLLLSAGLSLVRVAPDSWWLWVWGLLAGFSLVLLYLSPLLIEPLFFTYTPVAREELAEQIRVLMAQAGIPVSQVLQVDASRRSRHSNAYFTGIGRVKRIVLFDTLLDQMTDEEILAVLAHEAGHWRLGHIRKRLLKSQLLLLGGCLGAFYLLRSGVLPALFGYAGLSLFAELVLLGFCASLVLFPLTPLGSWLSRRDEWSADAFASATHGRPEALASALAKLARENLANLYPHPLYAWFYYSHPPVLERIARLKLDRLPG